MSNATKTWKQGSGFVCILSLAVAMSACGEDSSAPDTVRPVNPPVAPSVMPEDTVQAYEYLSRSLEACEDQQDECTAAAAGDAAKIAACDSDAAACKQKTDAAADHARDNLSRDTNSCWKRCRHDDDDAGTATNDDDAGMGDMDDCVGHHTPAIPLCIFHFVGCLRDVGHDKPADPRNAIFACVKDADQCFRDAFEARRRDERGNHGRGHDDAAGQGAAGSPASTGAGSGAAGSSAAANGGGMGGSSGSAGAAGASNGWGRGPSGRNGNGNDNGGNQFPFGREGKKPGRN